MQLKPLKPSGAVLTIIYRVDLGMFACGRLCDCSAHAVHEKFRRPCPLSGFHLEIFSGEWGKQKAMYANASGGG